MRISNNTKRRALALVMAAAMTLNLTVLPAFADDTTAIPQATAYTETADSDAPDVTNADDAADTAVSADPTPAADTTADDSTPATTATPAPTETPSPVTTYAATDAPANADNDTPTYVDDSASNIINSNNLRDFVYDVEIEGADKEGNNYVLYPGESYKFKLAFSESATRQMLTDGELTYIIPPQIRAIGDTSGAFSINIGGQNGETFTVDGNTFTINGDTLTVKINTNSENYEKLKSAANVQFWLAITGRIADDPSGDKIDFGNGEEVPAVYPKDATVSTEKDATSYDKETGEVIYTVTVSSKGTATNVKVTDQITGTALNYVPGSLQVDGTSVTATSENSDGFEYTIPEIKNGQKVTLTYKAKVDYSKVGADKYFTKDQIGNTVTVKPENGEETKTDVDITKKKWEISTIADKKGAVEGIVDSKQTTKWTLIVNKEANQVVGGKHIKDVLSDGNRAKTSYSGAGVTIEKYKKDGTLVSTTTKSWDELNVTDNSTGFEFDLDEDDEPYRYVLTYDTVSDVSRVWDTGESLTNKATVGDTEVSRGVTVGPIPDDHFTAKKDHALDYDNNLVNWTVTVNIPDAGLNPDEPLTLTDELPVTWDSNNKMYVDDYKAGSMQVKLNGQDVADTSYELNYVTNTYGRSKITLKFTDSNLSIYQPGNNRVLTLTYQTTPNPDWPDNVNHENKVKAESGNVSCEAKDSYQFVKPKLQKDADNGHTYNTTTKQHLFGFRLLLQGVQNDTITIYEKFDTLRYEIRLVSDDKSQLIQVGAGDHDYDAINNASAYASHDGAEGFSVVNTTEGATITLTGLKTKAPGVYYNYYAIRYYLAVKDEATWEELRQKALSDPEHKIRVENTATWDELTDDAVNSAYTIPDGDGVTKKLQEKPSETNGDTALFTVVANAKKFKLNKGNPVTVTDKLEITSETGRGVFIPDSVTVTLDPADKSDEVSVSFSADRTQMTVTIPDEHTATITYRARFYSSVGSISYKNSAGTSGNFTTSTQGDNLKLYNSGSGDIVAVNVVKQEKSDDPNDPNAKRLPGAVFQLYRKNEKTDKYELVLSDGNPVTFTTDNNGEVTIVSPDSNKWSLHEGESYYLKEIQAPDGYKTCEPYYFKIYPKDMKPENVPAGGVQSGNTITVEDEPIGTDTHPVTITKVDAETQTELDGAHLVVTDASGNSVAEWTTGTPGGDNPHMLYLPAGTYTLEETEAPTGYEKAEKIDFKVDDSGKVTVNGDETDAVVMKDTRVTEVTVSKLASDTNAALAGATLQIKQGNTVIKEWVTGTGAEKIELPAGTYTLHEEKAPDGYNKAQDITFKVNANGTFQIGDDKVASINMVDTLITGSVSIRKVDAADTTKDLSGAHLVITDASNKIIAEWDTNGKACLIKDLKPGSYTLTETKAPGGYDVAKEIHFEVDSEGKVYITDTNPKTLVGADGIVMKDAKTPVTPTKFNITIRKVGSDNQDADLPGAVLAVKKKNGTTDIDRWTTGTTAHTLENLEAGIYTLYEVTPPTGYDAADAIDFEITSDGTLLVNNVAVEGLTVTMIDQKTSPPPTETEITIRKVDSDNVSTDLAGAKLVVKQGDAIVAEWTTVSTAHKLRLPAGTYTLCEIDPPEGYEVAADIEFKVTNDGKLLINEQEVDTLTVTMADQKTPPTPTETEITIRKVDSDNRDADLPGAKLVVKQGDRIVAEWTSVSTAHKLRLPAGTYTLCETEAPKGYEVAANIEFKVTNDGKLLINEQEVDTLTVTMTDKKKQTSTPTPTPVVTPTPTPNTTTPTPTPAPTPKPTPVETPTPTATPAAPQQPATTIPRTADDYPLIPLVVAFLASGAALTLGLTKKRKHH